MYTLKIKRLNGNAALKRHLRKKKTKGGHYTGQLVFNSH